ncbi:hypothetical protein CCHR01_14999 [Colletotrichum chrysophilum]|uniref:Uncharacterized protein n=1 Tax=Colletotrichum chrysophilum TaxID=1836956 RepID=A0AAD9EBS2_9PEZI|nr:hypothetical protein CCHR01_14999 [Colletotrichum chrysophilum]
MHVAPEQQQQALHSPTTHGWAICSKHTADPTLDTTTRAAVEKKKGMQQSALWWFCCGIAPAPKGNVKARHGKAREARGRRPNDNGDNNSSSRSSHDDYGNVGTVRIPTSEIEQSRTEQPPKEPTPTPTDDDDDDDDDDNQRSDVAGSHH